MAAELLVGRACGGLVRRRPRQDHLHRRQAAEAATVCVSEATTLCTQAATLCISGAPSMTALC